MNLFALLDLLFGCGKGYSPLTALLRSPYQVLRACLMSMKEKRTVLDAMAKWCGDNAHTVCGTVDDCKQQQTNVMSVIKGGYIMAIEVKTTGNGLVPLHRTPPVFSATTTLPMKRLQTCLSCFELNELICHLIIAFFYNLNLIRPASVYVNQEQVMDIKLISCTALLRVNPLLVSNDQYFRWRTIHEPSTDTTCDRVVLLVEMREGHSYVLDPSFLALDPAGSYEKPYIIFPTNDREIEKWYKHMEFAIDFCFETSMKVLSKYQGVTSVIKMVDEEFNSSLCTALHSFNNPTPHTIDNKKRVKKKKKHTLKHINNSINIQKMIDENDENENKMLADSLNKIILDDASLMII